MSNNEGVVKVELKQIQKTRSGTSLKTNLGEKTSCPFPFFFLVHCSHLDFSFCP
jgi:hypothetical protein